MKKIILTIVAISISILCFAQSGGDLENQSQRSGDLETKFYFRFGYSLPTTSYLGIDNMDFWDNYTRFGGTFELGSIFMLNSIPLSDGLRIGINVDYMEFSYHQLTATDYNQNLGILKLASKVGPSLSYSPASKLVIDLFVKAKIPWVGGMVFFLSDEVDQVFIAKPGIGVATGINIRYRFLMLGFEYNSDNMKFEDQDYPGEYFGNLSRDSDKTPMQSFSFTLGFSF
jgi:hypothetical protein